MARPLLLLPLTAALAGCVGPAVVPVESAQDLTPAEPVVEQQLTVAEEPPPPPPPGGVLLLAPLDPVPFRIGAGYGALARVDVAACRARGLEAGYLKVRATFTREGTVVRASVLRAKEFPPAALDCLADQLRQVGVPAFEGDDVRLSKTYYVEPPPSGRD